MEWNGVHFPVRKRMRRDHVKSCAATHPLAIIHSGASKVSAISSSLDYRVSHSLAPSHSRLPGPWLVDTLPCTRLLGPRRPRQELGQDSTCRDLRTFPMAASDRDESGAFDDGFVGQWAGSTYPTMTQSGIFTL